MIVQLLKSTHGRRFKNPVRAGRAFAAYLEKPLTDDRYNSVEVVLSVEQAEELCDWLTEQVYGVRLKRTAR